MEGAISERATKATERATKAHNIKNKSTMKFAYPIHIDYFCLLLNLKNHGFYPHPKPWDNKTTAEYYRQISPYEDAILDNGYGSCILKDPVLRKCLTDALFYKDGERYDLLAYVIMPNHVHLLISDLMGEDVNVIINSVKRFTTNKINRIMGRSGSIWMRDNFDRLVRSMAHFHHCLAYIISNPKGLRQGDYELYIKQDLFGFISQ